MKKNLVLHTLIFQTITRSGFLQLHIIGESNMNFGSYEHSYQIITWV